MKAGTKPEKPLGQKAYGSIPHLPGSRRGPGDKGLSEAQARILTEKTRDKHDLVIVQEKLDGSNVAVAKIDGQIVPLIRAGYRAVSSKWEQHRHFHNWAMNNAAMFDFLLKEGERVIGEWLMQAHGTRYNLPHMPFVAFDIMRGHERASASAVLARCMNAGIQAPRTIYFGVAISIKEVIGMLEPSGHGAVDPVEGAVWRVERKGVADFLGKWVRPDKIDGCYLPEVSGKEPVWNWRPQ